MPLIRPGIRRLFRLVLGREGTRVSDIDDEIALHLELRVQQLQSSGMSVEQARAQAQRRFGNTKITRGQLHAAAQRRDRVMNLRETFASIMQDVYYAARGLVREPWFTAFVAITLGLGIGVNAAMYGVVDRLILSGPEHVRDPERLQNLYVTSQAPGMDADVDQNFGYVTYAILRDNARTMKVATFKRVAEGTLYGNGQAAEQWDYAEATADLFPLLGATPLLGRFFSADEDRASPSQAVVVLGYNVWKRAFNSDEKIIGKSITLSDVSYVIVGVARKGFTGPELKPVDVWFPSAARGSLSRRNFETTWNWSGLHIVARLAAEATPLQAGAEATAAYRAAYAGNQSYMKNASLSLAPISFTSHGVEPPELQISRWLVGVCIIVLIIASSNVANLLLARAVRRRREVAVRLALGVSRIRLIRLFLIESWMLSSIGAVAGLVVALATGTFMRRVLLPDIDWSTPVLDSRALVLSIIVAIVVGIAIGLLPALRASRPDLTASLKSGVRDGGGNRSRTRQALTLMQAALSVVLLVGAGLFMRSLSNVRAIDLGVQTDRVIMLSPRWSALSPALSKEIRVVEANRREAVFPQMLERMRALPEVESVSMTVGLPFNAAMSMGVRVPGLDSIPKTRGGSPTVSYITDDYFKTIGARILRGTAFTGADRKGGEPVAIVSETMAKTLWPNREAIGQCLYADSDSLTPCSRIIGIATDAHRFELEEEPSMHYFIPWSSYKYPGATLLLVRPRNNASVTMSAIRKLAQEIDPTISYVYTDLLQDQIDPKMRPWKLGASIFSMMGFLALIVAAIGLYSVMSYLVAQRRQELGIRMALGANSRDILGLVIANGVGTASVGVLIGVIAAFAGGRFIEPLLFRTSAHDLTVFANVVLSLMAVSLLASIVPALRARRVDPIEALRSE